MAKTRKRKRPNFSRFKRRFHRPKSKAIPILPVAAAAYSILLKPHPWASAGDTPISKLQAGNFQGFMGDLVSQSVSMTPDFKSFDLGIGLSFWGPIIGGAAGHFIANKIGVNRYMHKLPMVGKYISL